MEKYVANGYTTYPIAEFENWQKLVERFTRNMDVTEASRKQYKKTISRYFTWIDHRHKDINAMTREDILEYKNYLYPENGDKNVSSNTADSYLVSVRKFYEWAEAYKLYPNIAKGIKTPPKSNVFQKHYLKEEKAKELLTYEFDNCNVRDSAIVNLILRTGLRTIEVVRANIGDIEVVEGQRILRIQGKGRRDKSEYVVLTDSAYFPIVKYLETREDTGANSPLFVSNSRQNKGKRLTTKTISSICKEGLKAVGYDSHSYTAHSLRHTAASLVLKAGGTLFDAQKLCRHKSVTTTQIYTKMIEEEMRLITPPENFIDNLLS